MLNSGACASMIWINIANRQRGKSMINTPDWSDTFGPDCREQLDLSLFFKCISGVYDQDINRYVKFCNSGSGQGHPTMRSATDPLLLKVPFCRTEAFKSSFFNRIVSLWNQLPANTRSSVSFSIFKTNAVLFFKIKI